MDTDDFDVVTSSDISTTPPPELPPPTRRARYIAGATDYMSNRLLPYMASRVMWQAAIYCGTTMLAGNPTVAAGVEIVKKAYDAGLL
jgi:chemotaxis receptor (MCP) glutamine deamidase CheD